MTIIKQSNGIYQVIFQVDGVKYQKSSQSRNKAKALEIERKWRQEIMDKKHLGKQDEISLYDALDLFQHSKIDMKSYKDTVSKIRGIKQYFDDSR